MKQAILAAEDERFYQHGGVDYFSVCARRSPTSASGTQQGAGTITMQVAAQLLPDAREDAHPQAPRGAAGLEDRGQPVQGRDPRALRQPDLPRPARLRLRRGVADLLRQAAQGRDRRRGGHAGRPAQGAVALSTRSPTRSGPAAPASMCCDGCTSSGYITDDGFEQAQNAPLHRGPPFANRPRCTPSTSPRWRARSCSMRTARRPTRAASRCGPPSAKPTRTPPMPRCARACSTTTAGTATAARKPSSTCRRTPRADEALEHVSQDDATSRLATAVVLQATPAEVEGSAHDGENIEITGDGLKFAARALADKAPPNQLRRGAVIRLTQDDEGRAIAQTAAGRGGVHRRSSPRTARSYRAGRRLRFRPQQVQPRHAGVAPAGFVLQAVHLLRGAGEGLLAGHHHQRRAVLRSGDDRPAARTGSPRTTTASSTGRCGCAPRWPSPRTSSSCACCRHRAAVRAGLHHPFGFDPQLHPPT